MCTGDLTSEKEARWLFLSYIWPLLNFLFEAVGTVAEIGFCLISNPKIKLSLSELLLHSGVKKWIVGRSYLNILIMSSIDWLTKLFEQWSTQKNSAQTVVILKDRESSEVKGRSKQGLDSTFEWWVCLPRQIIINFVSDRPVITLAAKALKSCLRFCVINHASSKRKCAPFIHPQALNHLNDRRSLLFSVSHKFAEKTFSPCDAYWSCKIKPRCHMAFTTLHHIFEAIMLTWANQCNYFKNTLLSSKRMCSCELQLGLNGASSNVLERHTVTTFNWKRHPKTSHMAMESSPLSLVTFNCKRHS